MSEKQHKFNTRKKASTNNFCMSEKPQKLFYKEYTMQQFNSPSVLKFEALVREMAERHQNLKIKLEKAKLKEISSEVGIRIGSIVEYYQKGNPFCVRLKVTNLLGPCGDISVSGYQLKRNGDVGLNHRHYYGNIADLIVVLK